MSPLVCRLGGARQSRTARLATVLALAVLVVAGPSLASTPSHTPIGRSGVSLRVPEGFAVSTEFPGIGRDEDMTSLLVTELPVPIDVSRQDFDAEGLAARGIRVDHIAEVEVDGRDGWLAHASQRAGGITFRKWILLFGNDTRSVMLTATTPLDLEGVHQRALVETLRSARWDPSREDAGEGPLPFRIDEVGPLRVVRSSDRAVVLSDPDTPPGALPPVVSVGASRALVQIGDLPGFARRRLQESVSLESIETLREGARELDGMPAHEIHARAEDVSSGRPVEVTQVLATDGRRYYLVQAIADAERGPELETWLETLLASFTRTASEAGSTRPSAGDPHLD